MRNVTIQTIADSARFHADMKSSNFVSDAEILSRINDAYCELYDELVSAYENYFVTTSSFPVLTGTDTYDLPDDFYKMLGVDFQVTQGAYVTLREYNEGERNMSLTTNSNIPSGSIRIRYVPAPTVFTAMTDTFDGVAGWDRLVSLLTAIDLMDAEESDSSALAKKYNRTLQRIKDMSAPRDAGMPATVVDVSSQPFQNIYGALRYRFYGNSVVFMSTEYLGADFSFPFF